MFKDTLTQEYANLSAESNGGEGLGIAQMLYATALGLALGIVYLKSGSVVPCVLIHFTVNLLGITVAALMGITDNQTIQLLLVGLAGLVIMGVLLAGLVLLIVTLATRRDKLRLGKNCPELTTGQKLATMIKNPAIIVMLVLTVAFSALMVIPGFFKLITG